MSDYNWCHGPECHTQQTQSRIRGSGRNKVLRTIKIRVNSHNQYGNNIFNYFCNTRCLYDYLRALRQEPRLLKHLSKLKKKNTRVIDMIGIVMTMAQQDAYHIKQREL